MSDTPPPKKGRPRESGAFGWRAFFQQSATPVFVLGKGRRLRFANAAWERLTGVRLTDALGMVCSARRHSTPLAAALAPTPEAEAGTPGTSRRAAPTARSGPPWWDVTFAPLAGDDGTFGIVGFIAVVGEAAATTMRKVPASIGTLRESHAAAFTPDLFAGTSPTADRFLGQIRHAAAAAVPVWLVGEPGSGKETAARVIHHSGPQRNAAFVGLECAGLQPYLVESLLFGRGALLGTGHVGTLYLKEPAALPRDMQQRFADLFTAARPGTPRLVCGSTRRAGEDVAAGKLVPDFHAALSVLELTVPPLRDRLADLPRFAARALPDVAIDPAVFDVLARLPWPGNVRELANALADAAAAANAGPVKVEHLPRDLRVRAGMDPAPVPTKTVNLDAVLEAVEKRLIVRTLARTRGNASKAAEMLGVFRTRLLRQMKTLGVSRPEDKT